MKLSEYLAEAGRPVSYYPNLAKKLGGVNVTVFFCQLFYWWQKGRTHELGIYKTAEDWENETGLTLQEQRTARKKLKDLGVLIETNKRLEHRIYFALDLDKFDALFANSKINTPEMQNQHSGSNKSTFDEMQNQHSFIQETTKRLQQESTVQESEQKKSEKKAKSEIEMIQLNQKVKLPILAYENLQSEFGKLVIDGYAGLINRWLLEDPNGIKKGEYKNYAKAIRDWIARDKKKGWFESNVAKFKSATENTIDLNIRDWETKVEVLSGGSRSSDWYGQAGEDDREWKQRVLSWLKFDLDKHWDIANQKWIMDTPEQKELVRNLYFKAREFRQGRAAA
ncbi:MAG: hypothetical protein KGV56_06685 [Gammaproteobacteria bacterium]|nr:hypothetical protein [Gammaproteobacteria bacterium]